jgi:hypothetical protein
MVSNGVLEAELSGLERLLTSAEEAVSIVVKGEEGSDRDMLAGDGRITTAPLAISVEGKGSGGCDLLANIGSG